LGDIDAADALHALLAFFLFLEEFALAGDVAAVAFGQNVFAHGRYGFAGDDLGADRCLDGHFKHLPRDEFFHLGGQGAAAIVSEIAVNDDGKRIDRFAGDQDVELDHGRIPIAGEVIVERGVSAGNGFQAVVEIENDFVERQFVLQHDARGAAVFEAFLLHALFFHQGENSADIFFVGQDGGEDDRLFHFGDFILRRPARGIVNFDDFAVGLVDLVADAGSGGDEIEIEFALQSLLNDLHVEQAEKAAAEAKSQGHGTFRLEKERSVVQAEFFESFAELGVLVRVDGVKAGKNHGLDVFKAGQRLERGIAVLGDGVADLGVGNVLDVGDEEADFSGAQFFGFDRLGGMDTESLDVEDAAVRPEADFLTLAQGSLEDAHQHDHAAVGIEPGIEKQGLQPPLRIAFRSGNALHDSFEDIGDALTGFGADQNCVGGIEAD